MKRRAMLYTALMGLLILAAGAQVPGPLKLAQTITLPGLKDGDFDHFQVDPAGMRLFLAAEDNSAIEVIDLRTNKLIQKITGPKAPHSMGNNTELKKLYVVDDGGPNQVEVFDGTSFKLLTTIPMEAHADVSVYDSATQLFYVGNGARSSALWIQRQTRK